MSDQQLSKKERALVNLTVQRIDFKLDGRVPWRRRRQIRSELRSNLIEATREVGAFVAVQQLGDLDELAKSYRELYQGRFDFQTGSLWAVIMYAVIQAIGIAVIIAFHAGVTATGAHSGTYSFQFWNGFGPYAGSVTGSTGFSMTILSPAHTILMLIAFAIGSSYSWIFRRNRSDKPSSWDRFLSRHARD